MSQLGAEICGQYWNDQDIIHKWGTMGKLSWTVCDSEQNVILLPLSTSGWWTVLVWCGEPEYSSGLMWNVCGAMYSFFKNTSYNMFTLMARWIPSLITLCFWEKMPNAFSKILIPWRLATAKTHCTFLPLSRPCRYQYSPRWIHSSHSQEPVG